MGKSLSFGINVKSYMCSSDIRCSLAGATPFLLATWANDLDVMRELVAHGADPSLTTTDGTTPLMAAAGTGHAPGNHALYGEQWARRRQVMLETRRECQCGQ